MKSKIATTIALLIISCIATFAQKVDIDRKAGVINIDKSPAVKFTETKDPERNTLFIFEDFEGGAILYMTKKTDPAREEYFEVSSNFNERVSEVDYQMVVFSFNDRSIAANMAAKTYSWITKNGLNTRLINKFLNTPIETRAEKWEKILAARRLREAKLNLFKPKIVKELIVNGNTDGIMGRIETRDGFNTLPNPRNTIVIRDERDAIIAFIEDGYSVREQGYPVQTYDQKLFFVKCPVNITPMDLMYAFIEELILRDYFNPDAGRTRLPKKYR